MGQRMLQIKPSMDNQESTDNNNPYKAKQVTTYNPKCLSDITSIKTMLDNQDSQGNTTCGTGKPEPKILTHNHRLIIDNNLCIRKSPKKYLFRHSSFQCKPKLYAPAQ